MIAIMKTHGNIRCPGCGEAMTPVELACGPCGLTVRGRFVENEFASLADEDLHFLRIFVSTEGRIREMEAALGVSYPTIKARLAHLKATLERARAALDSSLSGDGPVGRISATGNDLQ